MVAFQNPPSTFRSLVLLLVSLNTFLLVLNTHSTSHLLLEVKTMEAKGIMGVVVLILKQPPSASYTFCPLHSLSWITWRRSKYQNDPRDKIWLNVVCFVWFWGSWMWKGLGTTELKLLNISRQTCDPDTEALSSLSPLFHPLPVLPQAVLSVKSRKGTKIYINIKKTIFHGQLDFYLKRIK